MAEKEEPSFFESLTNVLGTPVGDPLFKLKRTSTGETVAAPRLSLGDILPMGPAIKGGGIAVGIVGALVGPSARLPRWMRKAFVKARKLDDQGVNPREIEQKTGWVERPGLGWTTRISDKGAKFKDIDPNKTDLTVGDVFRHPGLNRAYKGQIKKMPLEVLPKYMGGSYKGGKKGISAQQTQAGGKLSGSQPGDIDQFGRPIPQKIEASTLGHEIGHATQDYGGINTVPMRTPMKSSYDEMADSELVRFLGMSPQKLSAEQLHRLKSVLLIKVTRRRSENFSGGKAGSHYSEPAEQGAEIFSKDLLTSMRLKPGRKPNILPDSELIPHDSFEKAAREFGLPEWMAIQLRQYSGKFRE